MSSNAATSSTSTGSSSAPHEGPKFPSTLAPPSYQDGLEDRIRTNLLPVFSRFLSPSNVHKILELASGNGAHVHLYSQEFPDKSFQPTECDRYGCDLVDRKNQSSSGEGKGRVEPCRLLDVMSSEDWEKVNDGKEWDVVMGHNFIHMIPLPQGPEMIFTQLAKHMRKDGPRQVVIYGPMKNDEGYFSENDRKFDDMIRARPNAEHIGLRSIDELGRIAERNGWKLVERIGVAMGNWVLVFQL